MPESLKILFVASECVPFAKSGGLGDVAGTLPAFLKKSGHDIRVVIPLYSFIDTKKFCIVKTVSNMSVHLGSEDILCNVHSSTLYGNVPVYFIEYEPYFGLPDIYHDKDFKDYPDNPKRFTLLSKAALQLCHAIKFKPDVVHANDWHTAILPALLKRLYINDTLFSKTASVLTIHNLAYQGRYSRYFYDFTGLSYNDFTPDKFEDYNAINFLKGGIYFADMVNTVSKGYAAETRTAEGGHGLDNYLNMKGGNYIGILNGVDYSRWDPGSDTLIPFHYTPENMSGKSGCKKMLQKKLGLKQYSKTPVIGIVSRFAEQKGLYILSECIEYIISNANVQFAILGAGDKKLEEYFGNLHLRYPGKIGSFIGYNNELAHMIEAGSDLFLMPSLYEPCGLNQIYSLKYGTIPIVRATGGLNDTIDNYNKDLDEGTGFKFTGANVEALYNTVLYALETYHLNKPHFKKLIERAMKQHFSWEESSGEYVELYRKAIDNRNKELSSVTELL